MRVAIIGAGISGITTAYSLAKRGYQVNVYERNRYAAMQTSYANGGQLSVSNSEVWTTWPNVFKGIKWMLTKDAPLLVHPTLSLSKFKWISEFLLNTVCNDYHKNTTATIKMGLQARKLYFKIAEEEGINFDLTKKGILHFYKDKSYFESARIASGTVYKECGVERRVLTAKEVVDIEPSLANSTGIIGGTYTAEDANGDIHKFCNELANVLRVKYNVSFFYGHDVDVSKLSYDKIVVCAGVDSAKISRLLGDNLNIYPVKGYSITIEQDEYVGPSVSLLDDQAKIVSSRLGNRFRVAGTAELNGINYDIVDNRIKPLTAWVNENFPEVNTRRVVPWAGLRPMTPSMLPIVKQSKSKNVFYNTGHGHLGWTLSAATAEIVSEMINNS